MIAYQMVGTNNLEKAIAFYDALLAELGASRFMEEEDVFVAWSTSPGAPGFCVTIPYDGQKARAGNGVMTAFAAKSPAHVDALHALALELGASDEGKPGPRGEQFYAAYARDLDGNKFNFFCMLPT